MWNSKFNIQKTGQSGNYMKTQYFALRTFICITIITLFSQGCFKDLDTIPIDPDVVTASVVFDNPDSYLQVLAKIYSGLAMTGQQGPAGQPDIEGIDEGFGQYLRGYWYHQELTTDEAVIGWNDQTILDFHNQSWSADDGFIYAFYSRVFYQIVICNEFLRETTDEKLNARGQSNLIPEVRGYRAEVRFIRALSYWHALDLFRNVPFVTEDDVVGSFFPRQIQKEELFAYIESELKAIENDIAAPRSNVYARADRAAVWTLLAKLYLNASVYLGTPRYNDCLEYCQRVINAGYTLEPEYQHLFLADNHRSNEIIFPIAFDGINTRTWGGMTFVIRAGIGGSMNPTASGVASGWGGTRVTRQFVEKFPDDIGGIVVVPNPGANRTKLYVRGAYQGWDGTNTSTALAATATNMFEGHVYFPTDNSPFFFTRFPGSTFPGRLGDNLGNGTLQANGDTIRVPEAGLYYIFVNLVNNTYVMEKRTWGIAGDATPGGWDNDSEMTWNPEKQAVEIETDLIAGQFIFRANGDPAITLGDNAGNALLSYGGANINIGGGSYLIRLYVDYPDYTYEILSTSFDKRGLFHTAGQNIDITDLTLFTHGYAVNKFKNVTSDGAPGSNSDFPDTDFPMFRLADVLLMASEAILRSNGNRSQALGYFNQVRNRAYGGGGSISDAQLDLQMLLDERARELYWECHRRTDLIRFGQFSETSYLWAWKGGVPEGRSVAGFRDVFPIPSADRAANPNLMQNEGY